MGRKHVRKRKRNGNGGVCFYTIKYGGQLVLTFVTGLPTRDIVEVSDDDVAVTSTREIIDLTKGEPFGPPQSSAEAQEEKEGGVYQPVEYDPGVQSSSVEGNSTEHHHVEHRSAMDEKKVTEATAATGTEATEPEQQHLQSNTADAWSKGSPSSYADIFAQSPKRSNQDHSVDDEKKVTENREEGEGDTGVNEDPLEEGEGDTGVEEDTWEGESGVEEEKVEGQHEQGEGGEESKPDCVCQQEPAHCLYCQLWFSLPDEGSYYDHVK
jgi:hypothetical protein